VDVGGFKPLQARFYELTDDGLTVNYLASLEPTKQPGETRSGDRTCLVPEQVWAWALALVACGLRVG